MSGPSNNPHTRAIAQFVAQLRYEDIPAEVIARIKLLILDALGCALYGSDLAWSRILRTTLGKLDTTKACRVWGTAERLSAPHAALGQRHADPELRARRRAPPGRAACRRGDFAAAARGHRIAPRHERARFPARRRRRLRDRAARRQMHGAAAYRAGLALRRHGRGVFGGGRRRGGVAAFRRADRARARHRRHPGCRADGRAIRRHGQAHACRARGAKRALRRAAGGRRLHRHRRCLRIALWRLLHDLLALERPLQSRRIVMGARPRNGRPCASR